MMYTIAKEEDCLALHLPIIGDGTCKISDCYTEYFKHFDLNEYKCDNCKSIGSTQSEYTDIVLPPQLIFALERFVDKNLHRKVEIEDRGDKKTECLVEFPVTSHLEIQNVRYYLIGVCNHHGNVENGHYIAFCKHQKWYSYNDEVVQTILSDKICSKDAYILFYSRAK